jgi:hypothetical protein
MPISFLVFSIVLLLGERKVPGRENKSLYVTALITISSIHIPLSCNSEEALPTLITFLAIQRLPSSLNFTKMPTKGNFKFLLKFYHRGLFTLFTLFTLLTLPQLVFLSYFA